MKISMKSARSTSSLTSYPPAHAAGGTIIHSRPPIFALTTSLSCFLTACCLFFRNSACCLFFRNSWRWCGALIGLTVLLGDLAGPHSFQRADPGGPWPDRYSLSQRGSPLVRLG